MTGRAAFFTEPLMKRCRRTPGKNIKQILYTLRERDIIFLWKKNNGEICIIKYFVAMRYAKEKLNEILPSPETFNMILTLGVFITLTVLNGCYLSGKFGRKLKKQLACLTEATARISENDLEFAAETSEIREVDEVMASLEKMKEALKVSLKTQWDTEQLKKQQLSALPMISKHL